MGKEEIARNEQFLLFPQCFLLNQKIVSPFVHIFYFISLFAAELEVPKIVISSKGLTHNPGFLGSSLGFLWGMSLGKTLQSYSLVLVKPGKDMNSVSCRHDMTEILLKVT